MFLLIKFSITTATSVIATVSIYAQTCEDMLTAKGLNDVHNSLPSCKSSLTSYSWSEQ